MSDTSFFRIEFGYSSSRYYDEAVELAENHQSYQLDDEDDELHSVELGVSEVELAEEIWELVRRWKSSSFSVNGKERSKGPLLQDGVSCFLRRKKDDSPEQYCFGKEDGEWNIWGCKNLRMPTGKWRFGGISKGNFDSAGVWHVDKPAIEKELRKRSKSCELCPVFNKKQAKETLESFPDTINPGTSPDWEYYTRTKYDEDKVREVAVYVRPVISNLYKYAKGNFTPTFKEDEESNFVVSEEDISETTLNVSRTGGRTSGKDAGNQSSGSFFSTRKMVWGAVILVLIVFISAC